jgi:DNA-binding FadR family transcriptional regulator
MAYAASAALQRLRRESRARNTYRVSTSTLSSALNDIRRCKPYNKTNEIGDHEPRMNKIGHRSLHDYVVEELGRRIVLGEFEPGEALPTEARLVATLGVSRTALREALRVLGAKGLVEAKPKVGTIVRARSHWNFLDSDIFGWRLDSEEAADVIAELHQLRHLIEPLAASMAATHATRSHLARLRSAYADMEAAGDNAAAFVEPDVRFHREVIAASGSTLFSSLGVIIGAALEIFFRLGIDNPLGHASSTPLHKAVMEAICARNANAARLAMRRLIEDSERDARHIRNWKLRSARAASAAGARSARRRS